LTKNSLHVVGDKKIKTELQNVIRQVPNKKTLGFPVYLWISNQIDSSLIIQKRRKNIALIIENNKRRIEKQQRINDRRIEKARKKNQSYYKFKTIDLQDTNNVKLSFIEWLKFRQGESPVIFDSLYFQKTNEQLLVLLHKRGYYDAIVSSKLNYNIRKKKVKASYSIQTKQPYIIDSFKVDNQNKAISGLFKSFDSLEYKHKLLGERFDSDVLTAYREKFANYMNENGYFSFEATQIAYFVDTNTSTKKASVSLRIYDLVNSKNENNKEQISNLKPSYIKRVSFHFSDTTYTRYNFKQKTSSLDLPIFKNGYIVTVDTINYSPISISLKEIFDNNTKTLEQINSKKIIITYNSKLSVQPSVLSLNNLTEVGNVYKESYVNQTVSRLMSLGLFQLVKPEVNYINSNKDSLEIHYYLIQKKQNSFTFSPSLTNSGVLLGVSGTANYTNLNLFRGAEKLVLSFTGGLQSMPSLSSATSSSDVSVKQFLNTFQVGPSLKLDIPGVFPFPKKFVDKSKITITQISTSFDFQKRNVLTRQTFNLSYIYSFQIGDKKEFQVGLPGLSSINYINFLKLDEGWVKSNYQSTNLFYINNFKNQLNWQDFKFTYQYRNSNVNFQMNEIYFRTNLDIAGTLLSLFSKYELVNEFNQKEILGIPYSQFLKIDNEFVYSKKISGYKSLNFRTKLGGGKPYSNSRFSLPFDYSFTGGGANDIRGWRSGTLAPGSYNYYLDSNYSTYQLGDIRLLLSTEYRFKISKLFKGALFIDAGNIWTTNFDPNRSGSQISKNWYKEIAVASGLGIRADWDYFVVRLDFGLKLRNPALADGSRWFFQPKDAKTFEVIDANKKQYSSPFLPRTFADFLNSFRLGIGYPF
jgi:outer membrane protein insertion porin family